MFISTIVRWMVRARVGTVIGGLLFPAGECNDWLLWRRMVGKRATNDALCLKLEDARLCRREIAKCNKLLLKTDRWINWHINWILCEPKYFNFFFFQRKQRKNVENNRTNSTQSKEWKQVYVRCTCLVDSNLNVG